MTRLIVVMLSLSMALAAQPARAASIVLEGGTVHTLAGDPTPGPVVIEDGVIRGVGPGTAIPEGATRRLDTCLFDTTDSASVACR